MGKIANEGTSLDREDSDYDKLSFSLITFERELFKHRLPHLLIFKSFTRIGNARVYQIEDTTKQSLKHHRGFIIETSSLLDIPMNNLVAKLGKIFSINMI